MSDTTRRVAVLAAVLGVTGMSQAQPAAPPFQLPTHWRYSAPLISPSATGPHPSVSQKDPSIVFADGQWHVFMTVRGGGTTPIQYCSFARFEDAELAPRTVLPVSDSRYYCAPQVFWFAPQQQWYLVYQVGVPNQNKMWVAYSTSRDISNPAAWSKAQPMLAGDAQDPRQEGGLDYWIICDEQRAYLFYTSLNGKLWRLWTPLADFPHGLSHPALAYQGDIFEASHTYRLKGRHQYLTMIEANPGGKRYFKALLADTLDGPWTAVADSWQHPLAGEQNVLPADGVTAWADNISHGELLRDGNDQTMTVDPANLRCLFQGVLERQKAGIPYGQIPWRIGLLTAVGM